jgi:hypothetical protein
MEDERQRKNQIKEAKMR